MLFGRKIPHARSISMRVMRVRCVFLISVSLILIWLLHYAMYMPAEGENNDIPDSWESQQQACRHPTLDIINPQIQKHIRDLGELKCNRESDWIETHKGRAVINKSLTKLLGKVVCKITYVERVDDFTVQLGKSVFLNTEEESIQLESDFFVVKCESENKKQWKNLMAGIHRNENLVEKVRNIKPPPDSMKLNVIMYGLDSMSRMHFIRKLPKTYKYLTEELKAVVLKGYNIVGDGTPQALIPILTGSTESELPETRKRIKNAQFVDVYPFAWKNFSASGYVTAWAEEQPHVGTFTYRLKGFKDQPTDHSMRTFFLKLAKVMGNHPKLCLGNKPRHTIMLDWMRQFYDVYPDVPKFAFCFNSELSHDDYNYIGYADPDIEGFLRHVHDSGILNNTLLIVMSDHGHRFAPIRSSQQGKQEERMPFFSFVLPPWMEEKYPHLVRNLKINQDRLVTPFDIHATFMTLLNPDVPMQGQLNDRSISLFSEIPSERSCQSASIEPHWCACLSWFDIPTNDFLAKSVGQAVVTYMNDLTKSQRDKCVELQLGKITRLEKFTPNKAFLTFRQNADPDGRAGEFSDNTKVTEIVYQVQVITYPSEGIYEAIVKYSESDKQYRVKEEEISRVNMYGDQEHCIHDDYPELRKYCYCKEQLTTE
ncbi:uncharacterized protein TNIN_22251 [Trichonephila inaurata madagascariensis]|uniref:Uncharacterized protein n=1 Tax=Trichonephila inaurata madagascariensis TaxID=2747483 RepID=A0A8X6KH82_9ARAC|nr:uncharacterized protein TNIN_22251 [Trichonephila inaurata madagascariensis]